MERRKLSPGVTTEAEVHCHLNPKTSEKFSVLPALSVMYSLGLPECMPAQ